MFSFELFPYSQLFLLTKHLTKIMQNRYSLSILFVLASFLLAKAQEKPTFTDEEASKIKKIQKIFTGFYDNKKQADTTKIPMLTQQRVRILPVWLKQRPDEYWVYSGWFYAGDESHPFQENFYQIYAFRGDTMYMRAFELPIQLRREGKIREKEWALPGAFSLLEYSDLTPYVDFVIFPIENGYRMESRPEVIPQTVPNSAFERIAFRIDRYDKEMVLLNEYYLRGSGDKIALPQGVRYQFITSNVKKF